MSERKTPTLIRANGCVLWRRARGWLVEGQSVEYLVIHRPRYDDWSLAKGKLEPDETDQECAARELMEETGYDATFGPELASVSYRDHKSREKMVRYWLAEYSAGDFVANEEVDEIRWLGHDEAIALLSYEHDQQLIIEAHSHL